MSFIICRGRTVGRSDRDRGSLFLSCVVFYNVHIWPVNQVEGDGGGRGNWAGGCRNVMFFFSSPSSTSLLASWSEKVHNR